MNQTSSLRRETLVSYFLPLQADFVVILRACLKRRLSDIVDHQMILDDRARQAGPGEQSATTLYSSAAGVTR
jgi:hypothetical protein